GGCRVGGEGADVRAAVGAGAGGRAGRRGGRECVVPRGRVSAAAAAGAGGRERRRHGGAGGAAGDGVPDGVVRDRGAGVVGGHDRARVVSRGAGGDEPVAGLGGGAGRRGA